MVTWGRKASDLSRAPGRDRDGWRPADSGSDSRAAEFGGPVFLSVNKLKTYQKRMRKESDRGNAFIEYLMLTILIMIGVLWFYDKGNYQGVRDNVNLSFTNMINQITK